MGGNALKNIETRRYELAEFKRIESFVHSKLYTKVFAHDTIPYYHTKDSFGDLDIIYTNYKYSPLKREDIVKLFNPDEIYVNGTVISFNVEQLQVDLIYSDYMEYDYALKYFSWNDCGNLIGKLCHKFGLKHGHRGLTYPLRDGDNMFAEVQVTSSYEETLNFLGLDPLKHHEGFDTLEDMFKFIASSKYFNPKFFAFEEMNHIARIRDKKRSTYNAFLKFCETWDGPVWEPKVTNKADYLPMLFREFNQMESKFNTEVRNLAFQKYVKQKFNGHIVSELTGLTDKELGGFMKHIRQYPELSPEMVAYRSEEDIASIVLDLFKAYQ